MDYRSILEQELAHRCSKDHRYSLRAFAHDLNLAPSRLTEILRGRQGLSRAKAIQIAERLEFDREKTEHFCDLVESLHARSEAQKKLAKLRLLKHNSKNSFKPIELDAFNVISDWYHFAILQLMKLPKFKNDFNWIAQSLGISPGDAKLAMERLQRLGLVEILSDRYLPVSHVATPSEIPSDAVKKFHQQILQKAAHSILNEPVKSRDFSAILMPMDSAKLEEAKASIREFRRKFCSELTTNGNQDRVYCLSIQFFGVST